MSDLSRLDLNLLFTLDMLLDERNVTRAANRLNLSQPAVSAQLARLREAFGDPLLLPGPRGMSATLRAEELRDPLRDALEGLRRAVSPAARFDPGKATNTWRIAAADYGEQAILLPALRHIREQAPNARLAVVEGSPTRILKRAEDGEVELGLQTLDTVSPALRAHRLLRERYLLVCREGHPKLLRRPTLKQFCALDHAIVSPNGGGFEGSTDVALRAAGLSRRVVLSLPHFLVLLGVVASTDLVAMLPSRLVHGVHGLRTFEPPLDVLGFDMAMVWHERVHRDPAHQWLRDQIVNAIGTTVASD